MCYGKRREERKDERREGKTQGQMWAKYLGGRGCLA